MTPEAWGFLGTAVVQLAGVIVVWLKIRKTRDAVDHAAHAAERAARWAEPTGNGFADEVRLQFKIMGDRFDRLEMLATDARDEIKNHKDAHVLESLRRYS
jgi:hypothetical protein